LQKKGEFTQCFGFVTWETDGFGFEGLNKVKFTRRVAYTPARPFSGEKTTIKNEETKMQGVRCGGCRGKKKTN